MFTERFVEIIQNKGMKPYHIAKETGISPGLMSEYKNGIKTPTVENLIKIADCLDCPIDYLLGRDKYARAESTLTENEERCLALFNQLEEIDQERVLERMLTLYEGYSPELKENIS